MALDKQSLEAIQLLMRDEISTQLEPMEQRINRRFDDVFTSLDTLLADEKREQESTIRDEQTERLEKRVGRLEKKVA